MSLTPDNFRESVRKYIEMHDALLASGKQLRELRKQKTALCNGILKYMRDHKIDAFETGDGQLMRKSSKRTEGLKKEYIMDSLRAALGDDDKVTAVFEQMNAHRNVVEGESLRRTRNGKTTAADA